MSPKDKALVGYEFEAYACDLLTGHRQGQPVSHEMACSRVSDYMNAATGRHFIPMSSGPHPRPPSTTVLNPVWVVDRDVSLDEEYCAPAGHGAGVEIKTPPLPLSEVDATVHTLWQAMHNPGRFQGNQEAGVHINISVDGIESVPAEDVLLLSPPGTCMSPRRAARFGSHKLDLAICAAVTGCGDVAEAKALARRLMRENRGSYETNALPLLDGEGYVEFRHVGSLDFEEDGPNQLLAMTHALVDDVRSLVEKPDAMSPAWRGLVLAGKRLRQQKEWYRNLEAITQLRRDINRSDRLYDTIMDSGLFGTFVRMLFADPVLRDRIPITSRIRRMARCEENHARPAVS